MGKIFTPLPEALQYRLHIYGEIVSAYDFRNADLYIRYTFDLPGGWKVDEEQGRLQILSSCTQVARTTWQEDRGEASFGCPLEIVILGRGIGRPIGLQSPSSRWMLTPYVRGHFSAT